ncbi:hypothetical protein BJY04DRAFT_200253 [Aspergillus karnatakaensis]|uniref:uncharacterized protein n=1 Tax=Aspergillus karnatakaensis TaxID=1810916 RepID=UPI003CCD3BB4
MHTTLKQANRCAEVPFLVQLPIAPSPTPLFAHPLQVCLLAHSGPNGTARSSWSLMGAFTRPLTRYC